MGGGPWAKDVMVSDPVAARRELSAHFGATERSTRQRTSSAGASTSSLTVWASRAFSTSASGDGDQGAGRRGRGLCRTHAYLPIMALLKELTLSFSVYYRPEEFELVINAFETGQIDPDPLVTRIVALEELDSAFASLTGAATDSKILVDPRRVPHVV